MDPATMNDDGTIQSARRPTRKARRAIAKRIKSGDPTITDLRWEKEKLESEIVKLKAQREAEESHLDRVRECYKHEKEVLRYIHEKLTDEGIRLRFPRGDASLFNEHDIAESCMVLEKSCPGDSASRELLHCLATKPWFRRAVEQLMRMDECVYRGSHNMDEDASKCLDCGASIEAIVRAKQAALDGLIRRGMDVFNERLKAPVLPPIPTPLPPVDPGAGAFDNLIYLNSLASYLKREREFRKPEK